MPTRSERFEESLGELQESVNTLWRVQEEQGVQVNALKRKVGFLAKGQYVVVEGSEAVEKLRESTVGAAAKARRTDGRRGTDGRTDGRRGGKGETVGAAAA